MELLRIRAIRAEMTAQVDLGSADVETLRRLAALDRYKRFALTKRRRRSVPFRRTARYCSSGKPLFYVMPPVAAPP
jgi:hypothetical protein